MIDRENAVRDAVRGLSSQVMRFIAAYDAIRAYDAAKGVDPTATALPLPEEAQLDDPVATVRQATEKLDRSGHAHTMPAAVWDRVTRKWVGCDCSTFAAQSDEALATILNALPALLAQAERESSWPNMVRAQGNLRYRDGVIKGLEMAAASDRREAANLIDRGAAYDPQAISTTMSAEMHKREAARIKDGGPIDGETGNRQPRFAQTYCSQCGKSFGPGDSGYSHCSDHRRETGGTTARAPDFAANAPEGQTQAGGAPGLPAGWKGGANG